MASSPLGLRRSQEHLRPLLWKILLGQLPADTKTWPKGSIDDRTAYKNLLADVITQPVEEDGCSKSDHPLSSNDDSKWQQYLNDNKLINTIHKDIRRISSDFAFVREWSRTPPPIPIPLHTRLETHSENDLSPSQYLYSPGAVRDGPDKQPVATKEIPDKATSTCTPTKGDKEERNVVDTDTEAVRAAAEEGTGQDVGRERREKHWEVVERILFVYAKTNVGVGYVQGLTDLVLPLYATMSLATDEQDDVPLPSSDLFETNQSGDTPQSSPVKSKIATDGTVRNATPTKMAAAVCPHAESDTFYTFTMLMGGQRNNFIHALDDTELGITGLIERVSALLKAKDPELSMSLEDKGLLPQYYLFQWLSLLFTRQFPITGVMMVWDRLLAMDDPSDLSVYMCVAMVMNLRNVLISAEFSDAVTLLQNFHTNNPKRLIKFAFSMYLADDKGHNVRRVSGDLLERALSTRSNSVNNGTGTLERSESNSSMSSTGRQSPLFSSYIGGSSSSLDASTTSLKSATSAANASVAGMMQGLSWGFSAKLTAASTKLTEVAGSAGQQLKSLATSATESYGGGGYPGSDSVHRTNGARRQRDARAKATANANTNANGRRQQPGGGTSREPSRSPSNNRAKAGARSPNKTTRKGASITGNDGSERRRNTSKINYEVPMSDMSKRTPESSDGNFQDGNGMVMGRGAMDIRSEELPDGLYGDWRRRHTSGDLETGTKIRSSDSVGDRHKPTTSDMFSGDTTGALKLSFSDNDDDYVDFPPDTPTASSKDENVLFSFGTEDDELSLEDNEVLG